MYHIKRWRSLLPAVYNDARPSQPPIPRLEFGDIANEPDNEYLLEASADELIIQQQENDEESVVQEQEQIDLKPPTLAEIQVAAEDAAAFGFIFTCDPTQTAAEITNGPLDIHITTTNEFNVELGNASLELNGNNSLNQGVQMQPIENNDGNDSDSSGEVEFTFTSYEDWPKPFIENDFQIKAHDMLSNNRPFKQNDNGDRAFKIYVNGDVKEVLLSATAVKGLVKLNQQHRKDKSVDKIFLKGLVIGVCTIQRFRDFPELMPFKNGEKEFIKGNINLFIE